MCGTELDLRGFSHIPSTIALSRSKKNGWGIFLKSEITNEHKN